MKTFMAFYQSVQYGKIVPLTANSTILQAMSDVIKTIHIMDFDVREEIQWPLIFEAISHKGKGKNHIYIQIKKIIFFTLI